MCSPTNSHSVVVAMFQALNNLFLCVRAESQTFSKIGPTMDSNAQWGVLKTFCSPWGEKGILYRQHDTTNTDQGVGWNEPTGNTKHMAAPEHLPSVLMGCKMGPFCQPGFQSRLLGLSTVGRSAVCTKPILSWFVTLSALSGLRLGTFRGILKKTFQVKQWHNPQNVGLGFNCLSRY